MKLVQLCLFVARVSIFRIKSYFAKERNDAKRLVFRDIRMFREKYKMRNFVSYHFAKQKTLKISFCISSNHFAGSGSVSYVLRIRIRILLGIMCLGYRSGSESK
jgi:hypothetical protein